MDKIEHIERNVLRAFFAKEWEGSLWREESPEEVGFSTSVLKKIAVNRRKEGLFNLMCITLAAACVVVLLLFVYPAGYTYIFSVDWSAVVATVLESFRTWSDSVQQTGGAIVEASLGSFRQFDPLFMWGLFSYLVLLAGMLLSIDHFAKKILG